MITFSDIVNFPYDEQDVDNDIRHLLATGEFKPAYEDVVREFLSSEIQNCAQSINDENFHLNVFNQGSMSEDALKKTPAEITPLLDRLGFEPQKREFWYNYFVNPKYGQQKAPPLSILIHKNKKEALTPFGLVTDPFYTVYTQIHELMHGVQGKYFTSSDDDKETLEHYKLLYKGLSRDEAKAIQKAQNPNLSKDSHYERCFMEMQANSAATCYMMLQAIRTGDENIINMVEKRLLNESATMSGALMNERLGLAYFEYPDTKQIIEEVKAGKCSHLLNEKRLLNWQELYKYTKEKIDNMGYSKEDMFASLETAKMLQEISNQCPNSKAEFLSAVEKQATTLEHPHGTIFKHFVEAQRVYKRDESKKLHNFYHRLGAKTLRDKMLAETTAQSVPQIEEYRKIYQTNKIIIFSIQKDRI
ncbi:MAG: hypothetical protein IJ019_01440 [Alphaproteobacteria bacterium]|nr:hypothetical protein [Alphaproteobacteria bacterium]